MGLNKKEYNECMRIVRVSDNSLDLVVQEAVEALERGEVLACPTDTVYGLVADATNRKAAERVFEIKKREQNKTLPVFVKDVDMARKLAKITSRQEEFLRKSWPGKVTAVLEGKHVLSDLFELNGTIALRVPNYELLARILEEYNRPLTATSANISGQPPCVSAQEVRAQFKGQGCAPDSIIDAGELEVSQPSTIIDIIQKNPKVIRP